MSGSLDPRRRNSSSSRKPKRRKSGSGFGKSAAIGFFVVVGLAVVGYGVTKLVSGGGASVMNRIANATGMSDTPVSMLKEAESISESLNKLMRTIRDVPSAEAAIPKVEALVTRAYKLELRAARAPMATQEQTNELITWAKDRDDERLKESKQGSQEVYVIPLKRDQLPAELMRHERDLFWRQAAARSCVLALIEPKQPSSDFEQLAFEEQQLQKRAKRALLGVDGAADIDSAAKSLELMAAEMQALATRRVKLSEIHNMLGQNAERAWSHASMKYFSVSSILDCDYHLSQLESQSVDITPLKKASEQFSSADTEFTFPSARSGSQLTSSPQGAGQPTANQGGQPQPFGGTFSPGTSPNSAPLPAPPNGKREGDLLRAAQPDEIILILNFAIPGERNARWEMDLKFMVFQFTHYIQASQRAKVSQEGMAGDQHVLRLLASGTPQSLADNIRMPLFKVENVDDAQRTITVTLSESGAASIQRRP